MCRHSTSCWTRTAWLSGTWCWGGSWDVCRRHSCGDRTAHHLLAGGANVPALNELLEPYGVAFGDMVLEGQLETLGSDTPWYASGANIVKWPAAGWLHSAVLADKASQGECNGAELCMHM